MITITEEGLAKLKANGALIRRNSEKKGKAAPIAKPVVQADPKPLSKTISILQERYQESPSSRPFKATMQQDEKGFLSAMRIETSNGPNGKPKTYNITIGRDAEGMLTSINGLGQYKLSVKRDKNGFLKTIEAKPT